MRLVGTAAVCAALAFGAAFLVGRAIHNGSSDRGGYKLASATISHLPRSNTQLASEFAPESKAGKLRIIKAHHRPKPKTHHASNTQSPSTGTGSTATTTPSTNTTPSYTAPTYTPPATTTHPSSSGQGSGTTSVGGSSSKKKKSGSGSGVTSVGGG
jgi:hypothetical protein